MLTKSCDLWRAFCADRLSDWDGLSSRERLRTLVGGAILCAIAAGLCALPSNSKAIGQTTKPSDSVLGQQLAIGQIQ